MITAKELYDQYNQALEIENCLKEIEQLAIEAAKKGETQIRYRNFNFGGGHLYGGAPTEPQADVISKLRDAGYKTQIRCEERSFVDIWLEISWKVA